MRTTSALRVALVVSIASTSCLLSFACAPRTEKSGPSEYLFQSDHVGLQQIPAKEGVFLYVNPKKLPRHYDQFIVDPAAIYFQPGSKYWIDSAKSEELARYFRQEIIKALSSKYVVVDGPGAGVVRMSVVIRDIRKLKGEQQTGSSVGRPESVSWQPTLRIFLRDSQTGERSGLVLSTSRGEEFANVVARSDEEAVKALLREWANLLKEAVDTAREKEHADQASDAQ